MKVGSGYDLQMGKDVVNDTGGTDREIRGPGIINNWIPVLDKSGGFLWYVPATSATPS